MVMATLSSNLKTQTHEIMNIEAKGYTIQMDLNELLDLAFSVKSSLDFTLKDHWVNHQNVWEKNEEKKLALLKTMFNALGRQDVYDNIFQEAQDIFKKFNNKNKTT
jgi:alpha-amylase/alpha-mannosidase (GH57 family)